MCRLQWQIASGVIIGLYGETTAAVQTAEKLNRVVGRGFIRGEKANGISVGFSPWGMLFGIFA